jgi:uncharacterized protein (TIGR02145 family)
MKNTILIIGLLFGILPLYGQIEQEVRKRNGQKDIQSIESIDSIRFDVEDSKMEIILRSGSVEPYRLEEILEVGFSGNLVGEITNLDCLGATLSGEVVEGVEVSGVSIEVNYMGGNGGPYESQSIASTGVLGLMASLSAGQFNVGVGSEVLTIIGTAQSSGVAVFVVELGGQSCEIELEVMGGEVSNLECGGATVSGEIVEGVEVSGVSIEVNYMGGNGGPYASQEISSTGVLGLSASLSTGEFNVGAGSINLTISGTATSSGLAVFPLNLGGQRCDVVVEVMGGLVTELNCFEALLMGDIFERVETSGVSIEIGYTGGNGGPYKAQGITSTGVLGLTASLVSGRFTIGSGSVVLTISGTALSSGMAIFSFELGGINCTIETIVLEAGEFCDPSFITELVDVLSPSTGMIWMDKNLGAIRVAETFDDRQAYGDLYQWGRALDGHQCRNSLTPDLLSSGNEPGHGDFFVIGNTPFDWRSPQNSELWQGVNGINNPCPVGYRVPTEAEFDIERMSWISDDGIGAFASPLKLTLAGLRNHSSGSIGLVDKFGYYWLSSVSGAFSRALYFDNTFAVNSSFLRGNGLSVRCLKEVFEGEIGTLECEGATLSGEVVEGVEVSGVSIEVGYTGGNGGYYESQSIASTGVLGLTASLGAGEFNEGTGSVVLTVTGTAQSSGLALFFITLGGLSCNVQIVVEENGDDNYPPGTVHCDPDNPTAVVEVLNPATGKTWMDRNLGASQVATSSTDEAAYGDLYQWGRLADGHQCRTSPTTTQLSSSDQPGNGEFILSPMAPNDWRSPQNDDLWQGVNGVNNPCPSGYRLPTEIELNAEVSTWISSNSEGAFASPLNLPSAGSRFYGDASIDLDGISGVYWSSSVSSSDSRYLVFSSNASILSSFRALGFSVRCIKD